MPYVRNIAARRARSVPHRTDPARKSDTGLAEIPGGAIRVWAGTRRDFPRRRVDEHDQGPRRARERESEVAGLAPIRAFLAVCVLATAAGALLFATRDASPSEPATTAPRSPDYTLTDAQAIAEFNRLNAQLMQAYEERNIALAEEVFTSDSPMLPRVRKEIQTLLRSSRLSRTSFGELSTTVLDNRSVTIVIERAEVVHPRFVTEQGRDATAAGVPHRQTVEWTLRLERGRWLLDDAVVVDSQRVERGPGS